MDACARALLVAEAMIRDGALEHHVEDRYLGWSRPGPRAMLEGKESLEQIAARVERENINPQPRSGRQEYIELLLNRYL
jgi:xylose isomerase